VAGNWHNHGMPGHARSETRGGQQQWRRNGRGIVYKGMNVSLRHPSGRLPVVHD
jgi:hypothetical protein